MSQNVGPLPRERCLTMRLYYNPYNPPPADFDFNPDFQHTEDRLKWCTKPECLTLGDAPNGRGNCLVVSLLPLPGLASPCRAHACLCVTLDMQGPITSLRITLLTCASRPL